MASFEQISGSKEKERKNEWLTNSQRKVLRNILLAFGIALTPMKSEHEINGFVDAENGVDGDWESVTETVPAALEKAEADKVYGFEKQLVGEMVKQQLKKNEVLFLNAEGLPVGAPVPFENFVIQKTVTLTCLPREKWMMRLVYRLRVLLVSGLITLKIVSKRNSPMSLLSPAHTQ